jgi:hypothetical protein
MPSRWDLLLDKKPVPIVEHLLDEVAKLLAADLAKWPLPVVDLDPDAGRMFAPLLEPGSRRPEEAVFQEAFRVARWELEREIDASAEYFRNRRYTERGLPEGARTPILFISRWLVEQLLSLREHTQSRISRPQLVHCLDRIRRSGAQAPGQRHLR